MPNGTLTLPDWVRPSGSVPNFPNTSIPTGAVLPISGSARHWAIRLTPQTTCVLSRSVNMRNTRKGRAKRGNWNGQLSPYSHGTTLKQKPSSKRKRSKNKSILRLPDLEHAKAAVLNSLNSVDAKRGYRHASDEFVDWYCSEPRLAFNRIVVLRYRSHLESRQPPPEPSICVLAPCVGLPTRRPTVVFSAPI